MKPLLRCFYTTIFFSCHVLLALSQHQPGDTILYNGRKLKVLNANMIQNPGFENGFSNWTDATPAAATLSSGKFTILTSGGISNSRYLVGTTNESASSSGSIGTGWSIQAGKTYYLSYHAKYQNTATAAAAEAFSKISLTNDKTASAEPFLVLNATAVNGGGQWTQNTAVFTNTASYAYVVARFRWLGGRLGYDAFSLHEVSYIVDTTVLHQTIHEADSIYQPAANGASALQTATNTARGFLSSTLQSQVDTAVINLREAIRKYKILNASPGSPIDMTSFIVNQGFDNNTSTGWTGAGVVNYHEVEFYQSTFDMYQRIAGLPAGKYALKAQGFERPGHNDGGAAYNAGNETIYAGLYAKGGNLPEKKVPFNSLYKHGYTGSGSWNGYVNNMASAEIMFTNPGNYYYGITLPNVLLDSNDVLTIGAKSSFQQGGYWALFDNFRLEYQGTIYDTSDYAALINNRILKAQDLLTKRIPDSTRQALNAAISQGQAAVGTSPLVLNNLANAKNTLDAAIAAANAVYTLYEADSLQTVINEAQALYNPNANGAAALQTAITTAQSFLQSQSLQQVYQAISNLKAAIQQYKILNASPANPLDMTPFIVNQGFDNNTGTGWTGAGVVNYHAVEFYQRTFDMNQRITGLPSGKYVLKAQGFERPKYNDGAAAYNAGNETIYARLYAKGNNTQGRDTAFNSLYKHGYTGNGSLNGYVNNMASAETMFTNPGNNYYGITLPNVLLDSNDVLTIGARSNFQQGGYWALFDNFRLEYQGSLSDSDQANFVKDLIAQAQLLLTKRIQDSAKQALNTAIAQGQQAVTANPLVTNSLVAAKTTLKASITAANLSLRTYDTLQKAIDYANKVLGWYTDNQVKKDTMQRAIDTANVALNNGALTIPQIRQATERLIAVTRYVDKKVYIAGWMMGDVSNPENNWSNIRSVQSKNWIMFWEKAYNTNNADSLYFNGSKYDPDWLLNLAEDCFRIYEDSLKFTRRGNSRTDSLKMVIRFRFSPDWEASGSGVDNTIGLFTVTPSAYYSRSGETVAHEVGHCFQYQVHCDNQNMNGWMYGFGPNGSGGNGWWEQCAQWQAFKVMPWRQFGPEHIGSYLANVHRHPIHEDPRYDNFFIQDYWVSKHNLGIIGRLWNESYFPEDPIEAYQRLTSTSQNGFNDQMYECAARFASWDIDALRSYGAGTIAIRPQPQMNNAGSNYWKIDSTVCIENYAHNIIQLNAPSAATTVTVAFQGLAGADGYRKNYVPEAGWRYGFVALLSNGTRVYSAMKAVTMDVNAGADSLSFQCPANCSRLWLVVSGAPKSHWRHAWDGNNSNDEQWPYQVRFGNTNLIGQQNVNPVLLPVSMRTFTVEPEGHTARLSWSTASELHNKGFYVERSADGKSFSDIGFVAGAGNSAKTISYVHIDEQPLAGKSYYRLRQTDLDGKFTRSWIQSLLLNGAANSVTVYPTSFTSTLRVNTGGEKGSFFLRDALGRTFKTVVSNGREVLQLDVSLLPAGTYFWQFNSQSGKIVKH